LAATFGRGAMTNHWIDLKNADVIMVCGSNAADNHPISMKWIAKARENGAKLISVDPRYTRTSSMSDLYCKLRSGTDIAFVGGMIHYALENDRIHKDYVVNYTNASFIVNTSYGFNDGLFSGYDLPSRTYNNSSWAFEKDAAGLPKQDKTLQHPRCVYQMMKKHFSRYDADTVCGITGSPKETYLKVCDVFTSTYKSDKVATWMYAMGTTQHTHGTQNIRSYAILQLLLGNIGLAGGGINALRGESNVQGSTDMALLFHILPGYLASPDKNNQTLANYLEAYTPKTNDPKSANWWGNYSKYIVSLLKAWYGKNATKENDFAYQYLPKRSGNYSHISLFEAMYDKKINGLFCFGQNPAVGGPNSNKERSALDNLDWLVAIDLWETETSQFWKRPGVDPSTIKTEVFLLPASSSVEKEGSIANSGRWVQWRYAAVHPPGESRSDLWIVDAIYKHVKNEYGKGGVFPDPITRLSWDYGNGENVQLDKEPDVHLVAKEVNGYFTADKEIQGKIYRRGEQVPSFAFLQDDGSTCSGNWLYCNSYAGPDKKDNKMARRGKKDAANNIGLYPEWAWCWPVNRRIIYNRASVDLQGNPWSKQKWVIKWTAEDKKWLGDVPDGPWAPGEKHPFIMRPEGYAQLWSTALVDGPLPEHYEPLESPCLNQMTNQQVNPAVKLWHKISPEFNQVGEREQFPIVGTTYRVSEHWQAGAMTRNLPWLAELVPNVFTEISPELAREKGIKTGDKVDIITARGKMEAYAMVTRRFQPFEIGKKTVHQLGVIWSFGYAGIATGDSANILTPHVGDANTMIPEYKAFLCNIQKKEGGAA
jgi:formate dehydrogenase major subunit